MRTLIVTGLSGAGKSEAVDILEDAGFYCVDNVPIYLVDTFVRLCRSSDAEIEKLAVVTDIRSAATNLDFKTAVSNFARDMQDAEMIYLDCDEEVLVRRYQESRRKHPLAEQAGNLMSAIVLEKNTLEVLKNQSDLVIDTTHLSPKELKRKLLKFLEREKDNTPIQVNVSSFGYKYGMPLSADFVFDVRFLPNPFYKKELRQLTGEDEAVRDYVMNFPESQDYFDKILTLVESVIPHYEDVSKEYVEIAFGCTGGQHRSVTFAVLLERALREKGYQTALFHRDIKKDREAKGRY